MIVGRQKIPRAKWLLIAATAVLAVLAVSVVVIQFPSTQTPSTADAIVVLGEPDAYSMAKAQSLLDSGVSNQLVISTPFGEPGDICHRPPPGVVVTCFIPDPSTTRGEAQAIGRLAEEHGWKRLAVVTWPTHISRSRVLIGRCFDGDLQMVSYDDHMTIADRISEQIYQLGAFAKVLAQPGC